MSAETASYVAACACPDDKDQVVDVENVIFSQRCARCGGILSTEAGSVYQTLMLLEAMRTTCAAYSAPSTRPARQRSPRALLASSKAAPSATLPASASTAAACNAPSRSSPAWTTKP
jgi:hypothetical protein